MALDPINLRMTQIAADDHEGTFWINRGKILIVDVVDLDRNFALEPAQALSNIVAKCRIRSFGKDHEGPRVSAVEVAASGLHPWQQLQNDVF
jgi:hypothetical protein